MISATQRAGVHPPDFSLEDAERIAEQQFGVTGKAAALWGERDQNFSISGANGSGHVLKISGRAEDIDVLDFQVAALTHLANHTPHLPVARLVPAISGHTLTQTTSPEGTPHIVHMISLLPGITMAEAAISPKSLSAAGYLAGQATQALRGFFHKAAGHTIAWDLRHIGDFASSVAGIPDARLRAAAEDFIPQFCTGSLSKLSDLRAQIIHHDVNPANVLVDADNHDQISGLLDFGDMIHGPIAQDAAVAAIETGPFGNDFASDIATLIAGYDAAFQLEEAEVDILYELMVARSVLGLLIGVRRDESGIYADGKLEYIEQYTPILDDLLTIGRDPLQTAIRDACRLPAYCPPHPLPAGTRLDVTEDLVRRRHAVLGTALPLSYDTPVHTVRGEGVWLYDVDGRKFLDCYNNVPHVGHCHPHVVRALSRQSAALNTNTRYIYDNIIEYAERLSALMPGDLNACLFVNSGSEANDLALRMARNCTGHEGALILDGAYHGITSEIYALSPSNDWWTGTAADNSHASKTRTDIELLQSPDTVRGPYGRDDPSAAEKYASDTDRALAALELAGHKPAAFMVDSAFATNGILDVPDGYLEGVTSRVRAAGGMIIGDEVQYGFGRSGENLWGFQNHGVVPDFVTLGKPIGNGLALGVVVTTPDILEQFTGGTEFFSTFGGNPVACAAGLAVLDVIERENLLQNAHDTGAYLINGLRRAARGSSTIGDVRGQGLFIGVDVVGDIETMTPDSTECSRIKNHLRDNSVLVGSEGIGGNILKIRPPMVFTNDHADILIEAFSAAIA